MINTLIGLMGAYAFQGFNLILTYLECYICIALFARKLGRRDFFPVRVVMTLLDGCAVCFLLAIWYTEARSLPVRVLCYSTISGLNFIALLFCWKDDLSETLLAFCSGMATYQFTNKLYPLLQNFLGINDRESNSLFHGGETGSSNLDWAIFFGFHLLTFFILSAVFTPKNKLVHNQRTARNAIVLSISTVVLVNILICISRVYEGESFMLNLVVKVLYVGFSLTILTICAGIFSQSEQEQQINILHQLWRQDRAQFESVKANMDLINMKCHDIKHILDKIEDKLTCEEVASLREAIQFYDANIKTGNEVLDVVLTEKSLLCESRGIQLNAVANGSCLGFIEAGDLYALFANALDHAVESAVQTARPECRVIDLLVCVRQGFVVANIISPLRPPEKQANRSAQYELKVIRRIVQKYKGTLTLEEQGEFFAEKIIFPLQK